jgi:5-formyltetrahydrofolate cyclo-ligase
LGLPVVQKDRGFMEFHQWCAEDGYAKNRYGIREPHLKAGSKALRPDKSTAILLPSVALATDGSRLGYGGGYYDRFLAAYPDTGCLVGVNFAAFVTATLPRDANDRPVAFIATEKGIIPVGK